MKRILPAALIIAALGLPACSTAPSSEADKAELQVNTSKAMDSFRKADPEIQAFIDKAYGYAVFPTVGKGAIGVGGAYGRGEVYEKGKMIGYCDLTQATIGLQLGGQAYSELICFEDKAALDRFTSGEFSFAAQVSAVALHSGASANAKYKDGVAVFTCGEAGLMYEASVGGQKFSFVPAK